MITELGHFALILALFVAAASAATFRSATYARQAAYPAYGAAKTITAPQPAAPRSQVFRRGRRARHGASLRTRSRGIKLLGGNACRDAVPRFSMQFRTIVWQPGSRHQNVLHDKIQLVATETTLMSEQDDGARSGSGEQ